MKNKILAVSFVIIIFSMFSLNILTNNTKDLVASSIAEVKNASYSTTKEQIGALVKSLENTFNSHITLKKELGVPTNFLDFKLFDRIDSNATLLGKDKWLFYKADYDGKSIDDYKGTNVYSEDEMALIAKNYEEAKEYYKNKGIDFYLMIAPNKEQIYSQYMPANINVVNEDKKADRLIRYLKDHNIQVIDPKSELIQYRNEAQLYYKNDTHWNDIGAFIGAQHINEAVLGTREDFVPEKVYSDGTTTNCDLMNAIGLSLLNTDIEYKYNSDVSNVNAEYSSFGKFKDHYSSNGASDKKILFLGDSFRIALENWLPLYYSNIDFIHRDQYSRQDVDDIQPDVVILEVVERHTDVLFSSMY